MFDAIANLFGYLMNFIYGIVQNYGIAIIIFTILTKLLLLPLTRKQQKSLEKAQELQPLVQELQRKYGNDQQRFAEEYQKLLKDKNMSMMSGMGCSGCFIQLIQIPIIFGMFYMMMNPLTNILKLEETEIENYKQEVNQIKVVEAVDEINKNTDLYTEKELQDLINKAEETDYFANNRYYQIEIMKYKDLVNMDFFGLNLCDITMRDTKNISLWIIPILSAVFTFITTRLTAPNKQNDDKIVKAEDKAMVPSNDEIPMPDMRMMNLMMPFMTGYIAVIVPQGVGLYWVTSNIIGVIQQLIIKKKLPNTKKDV